MKSVTPPLDLFDGKVVIRWEKVRLEHGGDRVVRGKGDRRRRYQVRQYRFNRGKNKWSWQVRGTDQVGTHGSGPHELEEAMRIAEVQERKWRGSG